jgi:hypothetical protein
MHHRTPGRPRWLTPAPVLNQPPTSVTGCATASTAGSLRARLGFLALPCGRPVHARKRARALPATQGGGPLKTRQLDRTIRPAVPVLLHGCREQEWRRRTTPIHCRAPRRPASKRGRAAQPALIGGRRPPRGRRGRAPKPCLAACGAACLGACVRGPAHEVSGSAHLEAKPLQRWLADPVKGPQSLALPRASAPSQSLAGRVPPMKSLDTHTWRWGHYSVGTGRPSFSG